MTNGGAPAVSPDGSKIAFLSDRDGFDVYVMNADGSDRRRVTHFPASDGNAQMPSWSPDDRTLAVQSSPKNQPGHIWIVDTATGSGKKLAPNAEKYSDEVPAWFPDGKRLAYQSDRSGRMEIWVMNADGSGQRQVTR